LKSPLDSSTHPLDILAGRLVSSAGRDLSAKDTNNSSDLNNFSKGRLLYLYSMKLAQVPATQAEKIKNYIVGKLSKSFNN